MTGSSEGISDKWTEIRSTKYTKLWSEAIWFTQLTLHRLLGDIEKVQKGQPNGKSCTNISYTERLQFLLLQTLVYRRIGRNTLEVFTILSGKYMTSKSRQLGCKCHK